MRQRRRAERGHYSQLRARTQPVVNRREVEARQRQLLLVGAGFVMFIIVALLAYGWFTSSFQPPRKTVVTVLGVPIKLNELVPYSALDSLESGRVQPANSINNLMRDRVVAHYAGELGVEVTDEELNREIAGRFEPVPSGASETVDELSAEGREIFNRILDAINVSEADYRAWLRGQMYRNEVIEHFLEQVPETAEQVYVEWIVTASQADAQAALARVTAGEDFAELAKELNIEDVLTTAKQGEEGNGQLGWIPEGALLEFDDVLFAAEPELNVVQGPLTRSLGSVLVRVTQGPDEQPITDTMQTILGQNHSQAWFEEKFGLAEVGTLDLTSGDIDWVIDQFV